MIHCWWCVVNQIPFYESGGYSVEFKTSKSIFVDDYSMKFIMSKAINFGTRDKLLFSLTNHVLLCCQSEHSH